MTTNDPVPSPCILVCALEPSSGHCYGCGRTRDEIADWTTMSDQQKTALIEELPDRVEKLERRPRRVTRRSRMRGKEPNRKTSFAQD